MKASNVCHVVLFLYSLLHLFLQYSKWGFISRSLSWATFECRIWKDWIVGQQTSRQWKCFQVQEYERLLKSRWCSYSVCTCREAHARSIPDSREAKPCTEKLNGNGYPRGSFIFRMRDKRFNKAFQELHWDVIGCIGSKELERWWNHKEEFASQKATQQWILIDDSTLNQSVVGSIISFPIQAGNLICIISSLQKIV
jgi:hypothetical protein